MRLAPPLFAALCVCSAFAQDKAAAQLAAEGLLAQQTIPVEFSNTSSGQPVYVQGEAQPLKGQITFFGVRDPCLSGNLKAAFAAREGVLIMDIQPKMADCFTIQYRFDPISKSGEIWGSRSGGGELVKSLRTSIRLK